MLEWFPVNGIDMVVSRYAIPTGIPCVDGLSTGPPGFGVLQTVFKNRNKIRPKPLTLRCIVAY